MAESAVTKNVVSNVRSVQNISAGAQYLRQATSTFMGGQGADPRSRDDKNEEEDEFAQPESLTDFDYPPGWKSEHTEMDK